MNINALNEQSLNQGILDPGLFSVINGITLWWFVLCSENSGVTVQYNDRKYENNFYSNQFIDWQRLISHLVKEKRLSIDFALRSDTNENLQLVIDDFKSKTAWHNTNGIIPFTINVSWETRVLQVITDEIRFNTDWLHTTIQTGTITVVAIDPPRFYSYDARTKYYQNISANFTGQINNNWNSKTYPVYIFVFNTASWVTETSREVLWYKITINESITDWDILIISSDIYWLIKDPDVYLNDNPIDYTWQLTTPILPWSNTIKFECDWSYDVDITIIYHDMRE